MNMRMLDAIALLFIGINLLLWSLERHPVQTAHVREQGRMAVSELRSADTHERVADPILLFQASLADTPSTSAYVRRTVYIPGYSTIRIMSGRGRIDLATTLSIHNTSRDKPLMLEQIDYHNTDGRLIHAY
jgi:hypothetical protein